jgi:HD domain
MLAEQLVAEARARRSQAMKGREWTVLGIGAACFAAFALLFAAFASTDGTVGPIVVVALVAGYALASRVRFEFGNGYVAAEQLVFVPLVLLAPLAYVPLLVATAVSLAALPDLLNGRWSRDRWLAPLADSWFAAGPVLVLAVAAPGAPSVDHLGVYLIAFAAHFGGDLSWSLLRDKLVDGIPLATTCRDWLGVARVDAALTAVAFAISLPASDHPAVLACIAPLVWLLDVFSREREKRYTAALELQRAYRGTVMLLADVIKFDDSDTAEHSQSVVDLVHAVAGELGVGGSERQELEFAALLHDVGKIVIPKEVLNKPAALSQMEFDLVRTHTIEGELMLARIGGLLARVGEIVRSCHERWDGGDYPDGLAGEQIPLDA